MSNNEILTRLQKLHEELEAINRDRDLADQIDHQTREALGQLVSDAAAILDRPSDQPALPESDDVGIDLTDRIRKFESDHPSVTRLLGQVTDLLAMMGI